jgi:CBS domain-containing protein
MGTPSVRSVMTDTVVAVKEAAEFRVIVDTLVEHRVSAVPVVDAECHVLGVVSEVDLAHKLEFASDTLAAPLFERKRRRTARTKAGGDTAKDLMSAPAVTIGADATVVEAARRMDAEGVKRLPVIDAGGRLVGIVTRSDLLRVYRRSDAEIRAEVYTDVLRKVLRLGLPDVDVTVHQGVVTLRGSTELRTTAAIAVRLVRAVTGVVDVVDELTYQRDDTASASVYGPTF